MSIYKAVCSWLMKVLSRRNVNIDTITSQPSAEALCHHSGACFAELAFPDHRHSPAAFYERPKLTRISEDICPEFRLPKGRITFWRGCKMATVPMPETAMYEDNRAIHRKHDVRPPRQIFPVNSESKA